MQALIRLGRAHPTPLLSIALAAATLGALTTGGRAPAPQAADESETARVIVVNNAGGGNGRSANSITLLDALGLAAADPAENVIQFAPALTAAGELVVKLAEPITLAGGKTGHDRIDGGAAKGTVALDFSACPDAGLIVGLGCRLTLSNLVLRGGRQRTVLLKDNGELTLEAVTVENSGGPGVAAFGESSLTVRQCRFLKNATHAAEMHGDAAAEFESVEFIGNGQSGIAGFDTATMIARDCLLHETGEWGIVLTDQSRITLGGSTIRQSRFAGVDLSESSFAKFEGCIIEEGRKFGIFATGKAAVEMLKTRVRRNVGRGIELQDESRVALGESAIEANGDYGVLLFGRTGIVASKCLFSANGAHGASLRGPSSGTFTGCGFALNRYSGVGCLDGRDGGKVQVSQCVFRQNGMRPIYRGPLHIDPLVPTPLRSQDKLVECMADPGATIELFLDRAGEAGRYLRTLRADEQGRFKVSLAEVPAGFVLTASATVSGSTSEFNVIAGTPAEAVFSALLGRTGPFSDDGGQPDPGSVVRRWKPGTRIILNMAKAPSPAVERYLRFLAARVGDWTAGDLLAEVRIGPATAGSPKGVVVPIRYLSPDAPQLLGRGGVTLMKWDGAGFFQSPMEILVALATEPEDTCPRVLAHEVGHVLGLSHTRVGLLSRMQGSAVPSAAFLNDFSPMMTFYDVAALGMLYDVRNDQGATLGELVAVNARPPRPKTSEMAEARPVHAAQPSYSPPERKVSSKPTRSRRR